MLFFFFKQKTAYEMRISDWSSDVCSSDLLDELKKQGGPEIDAHPHCNNNRSELAASEIASCFYCCEIFDPKEVKDWVDRNDTEIGRASCRERVCQYV